MDERKNKNRGEVQRGVSTVRADGYRRGDGWLELKDRARGKDDNSENIDEDKVKMER